MCIPEQRNLGGLLPIEEFPLVFGIRVEPQALADPVAMDDIAGLHVFEANGGVVADGQRPVPIGATSHSPAAATRRSRG